MAREYGVQRASRRLDLWSEPKWQPFPRYLAGLLWPAPIMSDAASPEAADRLSVRLYSHSGAKADIAGSRKEARS